MNDRIILPFTDAPTALTYHYIAFSLGIIQGNAQESVAPWMSSRSINCWFSPASDINFSFDEADNWAIKDKILFHQQIDLFRDQYDAIIGGNHVSLLKKMIRLGYYPHGAYNEEFIPGKTAFQNGYHEHDFILFGYDDDIQSFISAGYLSDKKYQRFFIPYECMERAISTLRRDKIYYSFWKYNQEATYQLNSQKITQDLTDYLNSTNSQREHIEGRTWGLSALIDTGKFILDCYEKEKYIDHRCTRAVMEFKKLMHMRIDYLLSSKILADQKYLDCARDAFHLSEVAHLLGVKFRLTKEKNIAYDINEICKKIVVLENSYLPDVLLDVQHSMC